MINREILYERNLTGSFMKIPACLGTSFDEKIMLKRKLPGLLPVEKCFVNNMGQYWYNITGKQSVDTYCRMKEIGIDFIERMIISICSQIEILEWNLVNMNCLMLDPELVYINNQTQEIIFTLYPDEKGDLALELQQLMEYLLTKIDHKDMEAVHAAYGIYEKTMDPSYSVMDIREMIVEAKKVAAREKVQLQQAQIALQEREQSIANHNQQVKKEQKRNRFFSEWKQKLSSDKSGKKSETLTRNEGKNEKYVKENSVEEKNKKEKCIRENIRNKDIKRRHIREKNKREEDNNMSGKASVMDRTANENSNENERLFSIKGDEYQQNLYGRNEFENVRNHHMGIRYGNKIEESRYPRVAEISSYEVSMHEEIPQEMPEIHPTVCLSNYQARPQGMLLYEGAENMESIRLIQPSTMVGQGNGVDAQIQKGTISHFHARIDWENDEFYLEDLNSTNGTFVNGEGVNYKERRKLVMNDIVQFADVRYRFV